MSRPFVDDDDGEKDRVDHTAAVVSAPFETLSRVLRRTIAVKWIHILLKALLSSHERR